MARLFNGAVFQKKRKKLFQLFLVERQTSAEGNHLSSKNETMRKNRNYDQQVSKIVCKCKLHSCHKLHSAAWFCSGTSCSSMRSRGTPEVRRAASCTWLAIVKGVKHGGQLRFGLGTPTRLRERPGQLCCDARSPAVTTQQQRTNG